MSRNRSGEMQIDEHRGGTVRHGKQAVKAGARRRLARGWCPALSVCMLLVSAIFAGSAAAKTIEPHQYESSFNGSDAVGASAFSETPLSVAIDQQTEDVYVAASGVVYKFTAAGVSAPFASLAPDTVLNQQVDIGGDVEVDNSGGETQGRIYAMKEQENTLTGGPYNSYRPNGEKIVEDEWPLEPGGSTCGVGVAPDGTTWWAMPFLEFTKHFNAKGEFLQEIISSGEACTPRIDSEYNIYFAGSAGFGSTGEGPARKFDRSGDFTYNVDPGPQVKAVAIDRTSDDVYVDLGNLIRRYDSAGNLLETFGEAEGLYSGLSNSYSVVVNEHNHDVYATNGGTDEVDVFKPGSGITVPDVSAAKPDVGPTSATLHGTVNPDGAETTNCVFEWGTSETNLSHKEECAEGKAFTSSQSVSKELTGLSKGTRYFWTLRAENANEMMERTRIRSFYASEIPLLLSESVSNLNTDSVHFNFGINPNGGLTNYRVEYGPEAGVYDTSVPVPDGVTGSNTKTQEMTQVVTGLTPGTEYHYRIVLENDAGTAFGPDRHFKTFPAPTGSDSCPNALVRKQTGAARLFDCRAYELVSAANQGGYDVDSDLVPEDSPLVAAPEAKDRFLYSMHFGAVPGVAGNPTTFGHDPYVARRTASGWETTYVGLPSDSMPSSEPYGSPLAGYDAGLTTFAFGGEHICDPCFSDGATNMPVRLPGGSLAKGMVGEEELAADPAGEIRKPLSADGSHFVFGSEVPLEQDGHSGEVSIYDRTLPNGPTHVVSKTTSGETMTEGGKPIAELGISADGSRVLFGHLVTEAGGDHWHLYMNVGDSGKSIDVTPGTTTGVVYDGMTADGGEVFFTDPAGDTLSGGDGNSRADLYRSDVGSTSATVTQVSTGGTGTGCDPFAGAQGAGTHWNTGTATQSCDVVALAGGAGVAAEDGTIFFLSPEKLDGSGTEGGANLFVAHPGASPSFVATIDPGNTAVADAVDQPETHSYGDFQVTPDGRFAVFTSALAIGSAFVHGHTAIYRYAEGGAVDCISCGAGANPDTTLTPNGLNLTDDGRVFFTAVEQLALSDTNEAPDVYEWEDGNVELISSGTNTEGSTLASASADGKDVFFFTRDTLAPQDENGSPVRIYDAREYGGFLYIAPPFECKASDECHGPGTQAPPPPPINTTDGSGRVPGSPVKARRHCRRGTVKRHGKCVRRRHHRHHRRRTRKHG